MIVVMVKRVDVARGPVRVSPSRGDVRTRRRRPPGIAPSLHLQISRRPAPLSLDEHVADPPPPFPPFIDSARTNQTNHTSLIKLENVNDKASADFYLGKKLCYVYKAKTKKKGTVFRTSWGKVTRAHGSSGVVRAKFKKNLPPSSMGGKIRCMLYPSSI